MKQFEINAKKNEDGSRTLTHPSYGMISITSETLDDAIPLFGQETNVRDIVTLQVSSASVLQNMGDNFYQNEEKLIEVQMSALQYAQMLTNHNSSDGAHCTIIETKKLGKINFVACPTQTEYIEDDLIDTFEKIKAGKDAMLDTVTECLSKTGAVSKADRDALNDVIFQYTRKIYDHLPYGAKCFSESVDKQVAESKATIDLHMQNKISQIALNNIAENQHLLIKD
jgi:hypothetical protein